MNDLLVGLGWAWIGAVSLPVLVLVVQVLAAWGAGRDPPPGSPPPPSYVVLMPAHNEAGTIDAAVRAVLRQLPRQARLLVVADNCSDTTAEEALAAGAEVVMRRNPHLRGKGYALAHGIEQLRSAPPEVLLVLDADCIPAPGALDRLAASAVRLNRPVQGLYLMTAPAGSPLRTRMAAFAWALKNQVRPLGLHRLHLPCQLMGSGMAFPWDCVADVDFASGHLTEDLQLGMKLAAAGRAPRFCPHARVDSWFPEDVAALRSQRTRWEHGHLSMIFSSLPLLVRSVPGSRLEVLAMTLDLCVPPLALLALLLLGSCGLALGMSLSAGAGPWPLATAAIALAGFAFAVLLSWWWVGRRWVRFAELASTPLYVLRKMPVYAAFLLRRQREWVRTGRQR